MTPAHDCGVCGEPMRCVSRSRYADGTITYHYACENCKTTRYIGSSPIIDDGMVRE